MSELLAAGRRRGLLLLLPLLAALALLDRLVLDEPDAAAAADGDHPAQDGGDDAADPPALRGPLALGVHGAGLELLQIALPHDPGRDAEDDADRRQDEAEH